METHAYATVFCEYPIVNNIAETLLIKDFAYLLV
jgi:hypothetical protein